MANRILLGTRKGLFWYERQGRHWELAGTAFVGDHVSMLLPDSRSGNVYAALHHGHFGPKLHRSVDGGRHWTELPCPAYPPKPAGQVEIDGAGRPTKWALSMIWALEAGHPSQPGTLWCGTIPGGLFVSHDAGDSWALNEPLWYEPRRAQWLGGGMDQPGIHSICVHPTDPRRLTVGVSCGGVWQTADGGQSWQCRADGMWAAYMPPDRRGEPNIQDPHRLVQCAAQPEVFWVQHHNGVFRTTDDCARWHEVPNVPPSTFGFAVAVDPRAADTAWFVPAHSDEKRVPCDGRLSVARTRDGGRSFEVLDRGLPPPPAYDIVFRHCLAVDSSGHTLALGSTTGSFWTSDDSGDQWQCVSTHLPPIYCVRFWE